MASAEAVKALLSGQTASGLSWKLRSEDEALKLAMSQHYGVSPVMASILAGRGVALDDVPQILAADIKTLLPDPSHLLDMDKAVARLVVAIEKKEPIGIFGDYDVDGATSSAALSSYLSAIGAAHHIYIPDRMKEGYGPNIAAFDDLIAKGVKLILTLDCGTLAFDPIAHAAGQYIDVMVIDHHTAEPQLPAAYAVVNPNRVDETSAHTNLCAAGVVFLLLVALNRALRKKGFFDAQHKEPNLLSYLDLIALGTVCDVMTLTGLNRAYVKQGLKVLAQRQRLGMRALADIAGMDAAPDTYHLGFLLGPRINAGGRVGQSDLGVRLLTVSAEGQAVDMARQLNTHNAERQAIEAEVLEAALMQAEAQANMPVLMVASPNWHEGVIGIVAGRLKEQFSKPAFVIALNDDGMGKGSARSVPGADIGVLMHHAEHAGFIEKGGGHAMAAGFSLRSNKIDALHQFCCEKLSDAVTAYAESRHFLVDSWLDVAGVNMELLRDIATGAPYGNGFASPKFALKSANIAYRQWLKDKHLKLRLKSDTGAMLDAITFNVADSKLADMLQKENRLHLYGEAKLNEWQGRQSVQFIIRDAMRAD